MSVLLSIIIFIIILAVLVLVHEFGHFIIAKKSGMQVEEFGFGFPPRIWGIKRGETIYSLNALPFGGFVKIVGENNEEGENPRSFINKGFWPRFFTLIAGVIMNVILAWVIISVGLAVGFPTEFEVGQPLPAHAFLRDQSIGILQIAPNSPAAQAGISEGDKVVAADGQHFNSVDEFISFIKTRNGQTVHLDLLRGKVALAKDIYIRPNPPAGEGGMGIRPANIGLLSYPWYLAPIIGLRATWNVIQLTASGLYYLVVGRVPLNQVGGPIRIAALTNQVRRLGLDYILSFAASLSVNLAVINIVPFPALDGGRVLFLIIEKIRGKRNNQMLEGYANTIGFALLLLLILFISVRDVGFLIH